MKTLFSTLFNVMLRSVTIDKIEEFHCYSFDEGEIYVALTQPHSPILKTFPPQEDFFCWWQISVGRVPSQFALRSTFLVNIINTESTIQALDRWTQQPFLVGINLAVATHSLYIPTLYAKYVPILNVYQQRKDFFFLIKYHGLSWIWHQNIKQTDKQSKET